MFGISLLTACDAPKTEPSASALPAHSQSFTFTPSLTRTTAPTASSTPIPTTTPTLTSTPGFTFTATLTPFPTAFGGFNNDRLVAWVTNGQAVISQPDGSAPIILTKLAFTLGYPTLLGWTPDGQWILATESCKGLCSSHIWAARPDNSEVELVFSNQSDSSFISWHPDGSRFLFECGPANPEEFDNNRKICEARLADFKVAATDFEGVSPQYSPNGRQIAWEQFSYEEWRQKVSLYVTGSGQSQPVLVSKYDNWLAEFAWMPDSQRIVYVQRKQNGNCEIYLAAISNPTLRLLVKLDNCFQSMKFLDAPAPNGKNIVYYYQARAYVLPVDAPEKPVLARAPPGARLVWSPDGKLIALSPGNSALLIDPESGASSEITSPTPWLSVSKWAPGWFNFYNETFIQP